MFATIALLIGLAQWRLGVLASCSAKGDDGWSVVACVLAHIAPIWNTLDTPVHTACGTCLSLRGCFL